MINASPPLISLLQNSTQFYMADLFTFELNNGVTLRYTSLDADIVHGGNTYSSALPIKRDSISIKAGLDVDELGLTVYPSSTDMVGSVPFIQAVAGGLFDGAAFTLERAFFSDSWATCVGSIIRFVGNVSNSEDFDRTQVPMTIKSRLELLNIKMPRKIYQVGCAHTLYDSGCALLKSNWATNSTVLTGSTKTLINCGLTQPGPVHIEFAGWVICEQSGYFDLGVITCTSGQNNGVSRTVKAYVPGIITLSLPLPFDPQPGDTFAAYAGCDKLKTTCESKFSNLAHFAGHPYVPPAETAYY